jgi:hypothetical protein
VVHGVPVRRPSGPPRRIRVTASQRRPIGAVARGWRGMAATAPMGRRRPASWRGEVHRGLVPRGLPGIGIVRVAKGSRQGIVGTMPYPSRHEERQRPACESDRDREQRGRLRPQPGEGGSRSAKRTSTSTGAGHRARTPTRDTVSVSVTASVPATEFGRDMACVRESEEVHKKGLRFGGSTAPRWATSRRTVGGG